MSPFVTALQEYFTFPQIAHLKGNVREVATTKVKREKYKGHVNSTEELPEVGLVVQRQRQRQKQALGKKEKLSDWLRHCLRAQCVKRTWALRNMDAWVHLKIRYL